MEDSSGTPSGTAPRGPVDLRGLVDLRGRPGPPLLPTYGTDAVVVVCGLPGSGKSTLLRRWSPQAEVIDPRRTRTACEARMPARIPYAAYRPYVRTLHFLRTRAAFRRPGPLLVHDCGSRWWMRRCLARWARRHGRELHVVLLAVTPADALAGQHARNRTTGGRVFRRHVRGLGRLLTALDRRGPDALPGTASVVVADAASRERLAGVRFVPAGAARGHLAAPPEFPAAAAPAAVGSPDEL
ncbi:AAA family ATPase [Kitasatospora terrestris]|uniref:ATP/GTP-binding protein n=1 Tax=Kitasatospora terrestris TaxID=258051 RepID=A0ABP9ENI2_9ACTN